MNKRRFNNKTIIGFAFITMILFFSFNSIGFKDEKEKSVSQFDYSGTNSLYIETDGKLKFYWITNQEDMGFYELSESNGPSITKGETSLGRVHSVSIDHELKKNVIFKFGGAKSALYEIELRPEPRVSDDQFKNVDSLFVVGDVHGRYSHLIKLLQKSNIIDEKLEWMAGKSHLVFLGDLFDRGDEVTKLLWFIYELEPKAAAAGGKVHIVLGNHEIMTMTKDLRYLGRKERALSVAHQKPYDYMFHPTKSFLGSWLESKPAVLKIDKAIFAHGGIVKLETNSIKGYNKLVHTYMKDPIFMDIMKDAADSTKYSANKWQQMRYFFYREDSPFWYRGYVKSDTLAAQLNLMLRTYKSNVHIVAHTPLKTITQRYHGKLLTTDLNEAATQLLFLVKNKNKYTRFKIDSAGNISELDK